MKAEEMWTEPKHVTSSDNISKENSHSDDVNEAELIYWHSVIELNTISGYEAYKAKYPSGHYRALADSCILKLEENKTINKDISFSNTRSLKTLVLDNKIIFFLAVAILLLTLLFSSGYVRFGLEGPFIYILISHKFLKNQ